MKIQVTQEDIDKGERGKACRCPVALAVKRETKTLAIVDRDCIYCELGYKRFANPLNVTKFIDDFDKALPVEPFEFELSDD